MSFSRFADGGLIDREKTLRFRFDGATIEAHPGDTVASALLASGRLLMGRSFKYHRPRSLVSGGASEPNALITTGIDGHREPNRRASMVTAADGLVVESQNRFPSLGFDLGAVNGLAGRFLGAGFYYKTFMWPQALWEKLYEPAIRRMAGLGRASHAPDERTYEKRWGHCDLLVIGAGPAGLMAALTAARAGARVILADENASVGGRLLQDRVEIGDRDGPGFAASVLAELESLPNASVLTDTTVFGWYDSGVFGAVERRDGADQGPDERLWRIIAREAVMATGAEERPLVFGNNDRPGIMTASALRGLVNRQAIRPGDRAIVFTTGPSGHETARDLVARGLDVTLVDARPDIPEFERLASAGARVIENAVVADARGGRAVSGADIIHRGNGKTERIIADCLAMTGGWSPVIHLACQRGGKPVWNDDEGGYFGAPVHTDGLLVAGAAAGDFSLAGALANGARVAGEAVARLGFTAKAVGLPAVREACGGSTGFSALFHVAEARGKAFVDFQNDVTASDLKLAVQEGYGHVELAKRYTTSGMATDQGKTANVNAAGILAGLRRVSVAQAGLTTFRPFYTPVSIGALAGPHSGPHYRPVRRSPLHQWATRRGAVFIEAGPWLRVSHFPQEGEPTWREAALREAKAVRAGAGITDVSTLGKIDVSGRDAAAFLDLVYTGRMSSLAIGKARYGLMLREDGMLMDDGTVTRLAEQHFLVTTTTAAAGDVMAHMEFAAQVLFPHLDVQLASVSDQWAQVALAGPASRAILARITGADVSDEALPFPGAREITLHGGVPARLFRISFSGETGFEIAVPARYGAALADALMEAGAPFGITPYGLEALNILRIEKGFITHAEIDGRVTAEDLGLGKMVVRSKPDFIGKALSAREGLVREGREQLVGLHPVKPEAKLLAGAHLLERGSVPSMANDQGHVTSSCPSPHRDGPLALAMLKNGRSRHGEQLTAWDPLRGYETTVIVCDPVFVRENRADVVVREDLAPVALALPETGKDAVVGKAVGVTVTRLGERPLVLLCGEGRVRQADLEASGRAGDGVVRPVSPGQVMAAGKPGEGAAAFRARLSLAPGLHAVSIGHARVAFQIDGPQAAAFLGSQTAVDCERFAVGASAPTLFGHHAGQLTRLGADRFEVMVYSTYVEDFEEQIGTALQLFS